MTFRAKYRNVWTEYDGRKYHSKAEAHRAWELDMMLRAGTILHWRPQPRYRLGCPENVYVADFEVTGCDYSNWTEDVKGMETHKFKRDKKLWKAYGPHELRILKRRGKRWDVEVIPGRKEGTT